MMMIFGEAVIQMWDCMQLAVNTNSTININQCMNVVQTNNEQVMKLIKNCQVGSHPAFILHVFSSFSLIANV